MAKKTGKAGRRATTAGRDRPKAPKSKARRSGAPKAYEAGSRKPNPTKSMPHKASRSAASEVARLREQLKTARLQQEASAEILRAVANAAGDAAGPLQLIAETTARLFDASSASIQLAEGREFTQEYRVGAIAKRVGSAYPRSNIKVGGRNLPGTVVAENRQIHIPDLDHLDPAMSDFPGLPHARAGGARTVCGTPLRREGGAVGALIVFRDRLAPFTDDELALQQSFADQAVIAIANARLFNEVQAKTRDLEESLEQQTATSEVLSVINASPGDLAPVFNAMVDKALRLCGASYGAFAIFEGDHYRALSLRGGMPDEFTAFVTKGVLIAPGSPPDRVRRGEDIIHIHDLCETPPERLTPGLQAMVNAGARTSLWVSLRKETTALGFFGIYRTEARPFSERDIDLVRNFASQAVIAIENARLLTELRESLAQQTATADVLKVISRSAYDLQTVLETLIKSAVELSGANRGSIFLREGDVFPLKAASSTTPEFLQYWATNPARAGRSTATARVIASGKVEIIPDVLEDPDVDMPADSLAKIRAAVGVPMLRDNNVEGVLVLTRPEPGLFSKSQIDLVQTFADQAMIAIENTRLFDETQEALARQTATSDILRVISGSPTDVQPVFDAIVRTAVRLIGCDRAFFMRVDGQTYTPVAGVSRDGSIPLGPANQPVDPAASFPSRAIVAKQMLHLPDWSRIELPDHERRIYDLHGARSSLFLPLLRGDGCIGLLALVASRPNMFGETEIALAESFRDQALIAIENTRLFNETQEALERQTATADILKVIASSPDDVQPVFDAIASSARRLIGGFSTAVHLVIDDMVHLVAFTPTNPESDKILVAAHPRHRREVGAVALVEHGEIAQIADSEAADAHTRQLGRARGWRGLTLTPLMSHGNFIGFIASTRRETGVLGNHHIELLRTFADQAVIAIENARLFDEVQAKTRDLTEALTYQTGSANILNVIASSPTDVTPVLKAIVESACEVCEAYDAAVLLRDGDDLRFSAHHGPIPVGLEKWPINRRWTAGRAVIDQKTIHIEDLRDERHADFSDGRELSLRMGHRTIVSVPLLREGESIGAIVLRRIEVHPFSDKQIALLQTFADQAVIALGNVRLFEEVQAKTRDLTEALQQQTATADVLKVISRSAFDLQTVLETLARSAVELSGALNGVIFLRDGDVFRYRASSHSENPEWVKWLEEHPQRPGRKTATARAIATGKVACVEDVAADPEVDLPATPLAGIRAALGVPLLRDGRVEGVMTLTRQVPGPFADRQIELVQTFADQAVIAIENVRLFEEVQARTRELAKSLEDLRTAQDRLVQTEKLASLGQLTAGIAHEIKNPLNFVNNFSALSVELTDELNDLLNAAKVSEEMRREVDELTSLLKENLVKVVQHGKRADSIVKNMLLHSREGSGELRSTDINAIVEESLNLAYHGARAEKSGFNVSLERDFDVRAGAIDLFPQEITRALLNLISNGFYAASKRKADLRDETFEPVLRAMTRSAGKTVEIRIRDNGAGISPEVREKIFNPFFTTKPAGEGTGLGLSMTHDIIVKQHGGRIEVETEPGSFTEFIITLPRDNGTVAAQRPD